VSGLERARVASLITTTLEGKECEGVNRKEETERKRIWRQGIGNIVSGTRKMSSDVISGHLGLQVNVMK